MSEVWFLLGFEAGCWDPSPGIPRLVLAQYWALFPAFWDCFCSLTWEDVWWRGLAPGRAPACPRARGAVPGWPRCSGSIPISQVNLGIIQLLPGVCEMQTPTRIPDDLPWENCSRSRNQKIQVFLFWQFRGNKRATN